MVKKEISFIEGVKQGRIGYVILAVIIVLWPILIIAMAHAHRAR